MLLLGSMLIVQLEQIPKVFRTVRSRCDGISGSACSLPDNRRVYSCRSSEMSSSVYIGMCLNVLLSIPWYVFECYNILYFEKIKLQTVIVVQLS